jgi:hypothetical protein
MCPALLESLGGLWTEKRGFVLFVLVFTGFVLLTMQIWVDGQLPAIKMRAELFMLGRIMRLGRQKLFQTLPNRSEISESIVGVNSESQNRFYLDGFITAHGGTEFPARQCCHHFAGHLATARLQHLKIPQRSRAIENASNH